jgi:hypothetical protein
MLRNVYILLYVTLPSILLRLLRKMHLPRYRVIPMSQRNMGIIIIILDFLITFIKKVTMKCVRRRRSNVFYSRVLTFL